MDPDTVNLPSIASSFVPDVETFRKCWLPIFVIAPNFYWLHIYNYLLRDWERDFKGQKWVSPQPLYTNKGYY